MTLSGRWWIAAVPAGAVILGTGPLYVGRYGLSPLWFTPLAVVGVVAAAHLGVRRARSASLGARLRGGVLWAAVWVAILPLPAAIRSGLILWGAYSAPAPPGATYVIAPGDHVEYGLHVRPGDLTECGGYQVLWRSTLSADAIERFYRERLPRSGWSLRRRDEVNVPAGGGVVRMLRFRRADGLLTLRIAAAPGVGGFGLVYDHLPSSRGYP